MAESLTDLPQNVLMEILSRLPFKTLLATRCVCKTLRGLTSPLTPHFIALHSSKATQTLMFQFGEASKPSNVLYFVEPEVDIAPGVVEKFRWIPALQVAVIPGRRIVFYRSIRDKVEFSLVNSCNGLVYLVRRYAWVKASVVCNPVTHECVVIPDVDYETKLQSRTKSMWLGFSPGSNQYKVLRIFSSKNYEPVEVGAQVLVVGSSSWRDINGTLVGRDHSWDASATFLNGVIYWLDQSWNDILFFDFEREMFGNIALPIEFWEEQLKNKNCIDTAVLGVLGDCLCLSFNAINAQHVDICIMKKHGNLESWSKEFVCNLMNRPVGGQFKPLQVLRNGEILMHWINNDLVCYDPKKKSLRFVGFDLRKDNPKAVAFTPSFVSLDDTLSADKVVERGKEVKKENRKKKRKITY